MYSIRFHELHLVLLKLTILLSALLAAWLELVLQPHGIWIKLNVRFKKRD
jgi:hypothetical protein